MRKEFGVATVLVLLLGQGLRADFTVDFTVANSGLALSKVVGSPYAELTVKTNANGTVTFTVTNLGEASQLGMLGFNLNGITTNDFKLVSGPSNWGLQGSGEMSGFGRYDEEFGPGPNSLRQTSYSFVLASTQSGKTLTASDFLAANSGNAGIAPGIFDFALEVFPSDGNTGFAGAPALPAPPSVAPAPPSVALFALAAFCGGLVWWRRRKRPLTV
jgi:hypothetical protein